MRRKLIDYLNKRYAAIEKELAELPVSQNTPAQDKLLGQKLELIMLAAHFELHKKKPKATGSLIDNIRRAKVRAAEETVIEHLDELELGGTIRKTWEEKK